MKKSIWIFLFAVLLPGFVLGWLALRSAEEQQIIFERRTAELYQKETEGLAASAREVVEAERRAFGDTVHRLLARSDAGALARDFTNSLMDAWPRKAVGFVLGKDGEMLSPTTTMAAKNADLRDFLWNNGSFLCSTQPAVVYPVPIDANTKSFSYNVQGKNRSGNVQDAKPALSVSNGPDPTVLAQKGAGQQQASSRYAKVLIPKDEPAKTSPAQQEEAPETKQKMEVIAGVQAPAETAVAEQLPRAAIPAPKAAAPTPDTDRVELAKRLATAKKQPAATGAFGGAQLEPAHAPAPAAGAAPAPLPSPAPLPTASVPPPAPAPAPVPSAPTDLAAQAAPAPDAPAAMPALTLNRGMNELQPEDKAKERPSKLALPLRNNPSATRAVKNDATAVLKPSTEGASAAQVANPEPSGAATGAVGVAQTGESFGGVARAKDVEKKAPDAYAGGRQQAVKVAEKQQPQDAQQPQSNADALAVGKPMENAAATATIQARGRSVVPEVEALADSKQVAVISDPIGNSQTAQVANSAPTQQAMFSRLNQDALNRMVEPQQQIRAATSNWSAILPSTADFRALTAENDEGMLARFVQDKLDLVFWIRPPESPEMVFGCLIDAGDLNQLWKDVFASRATESASERPPYVLALLNDKAKPVATFPAGDMAREWKRPFVANEIGEVLPHWEAALYLATPTAMADTARGLRRTLSFTIAGAIALIAIGGWLVVHDVRRQLALAQQKTDFVSNVSHELKTPLTSIRMFAELMHDRPPPQEKQGQYLRIIQVEAERLTRLINNVLDFAKLERKQKRFDKKPLDLCCLITRVWEGQEMHLRDAGFTTRWQAAPGPYEVLGDEDALAQVLVNLLSNAEKYSQDKKDIELVTWIEGGWINASILDRGIGVPDGEERKIFEAFYRAHDSLSSGIQGSGLGLTLAQRLAHEHNGEITFDRRQGGGSRFNFRMPLVAHASTEDSSEGLSPA